MKESPFNRRGMDLRNPKGDAQDNLKLLDQESKRDAQDIRISVREKEVLEWVERGKSSLEISLILGISERTVNAYIYKLMEKLEAVNRPQMVSIALRRGVIR
jgi:DNA-binding CsgD family transcriptional regulator